MERNSSGRKGEESDQMMYSMWTLAYSWPLLWIIGTKTLDYLCITLIWAAVGF